MTKRPNTSSPAPAQLKVKRPRKAAGFRLARPPSPSGSQPTTSSSSSLFVTVTQNEGRPGILAQSRVITNDLETVEQSTIPVTNSQIQDPCNEIPDDFILGEQLEEAGPSDPQEPQEPKRKRQTTNYVRPSKHCTDLFILVELIHHQDKLKEWLPFRNVFLDELLRHDGLGDFLGHSKCPKCKEQDGVFKCKDCPNGRMLKCQGCIVSLHQELPLHRVEVRVGSPDNVNEIT